MGTDWRVCLGRSWHLIRVWYDISKRCLPISKGSRRIQVSISIVPKNIYSYYYQLTPTLWPVLITKSSSNYWYSLTHLFSTKSTQIKQLFVVNCVDVNCKCLSFFTSFTREQVECCPNIITINIVRSIESKYSHYFAGENVL